MKLLHELFAALGDEMRLGLVNRLAAAGPLSTAQLQAGMPITRQAVAKHLETLAAAGIVRGERVGRERRWSIATVRLAEARGALYRLARQWDALG